MQKSVKIIQLMKFFVNEVNHVVVIGWGRVHMLSSRFYLIFFQASE